MDGSCRALGHALAAELAFVEIDVGQIVLDGDSTEGAGLLALTAAYTCGGACLAGYSALILVHAGDIDPTVLRTFVPQFDDAFGTCLDTGTACRALVLVHLGNEGLGIDLDSSELAGFLTVPAAQTAVPAGSVTTVEGAHDTAGGGTVVLAGAYSVGTGAVAPYHSYHWSLFLHGDSEMSGHLLHDGIASHRAELAVKGPGLDACLGESPAAGETAAAAVGSGHSGLNDIDEGILHHLELLRNKE